MPDLGRKAVHEFWKDYSDPAIYRAISFMEAVEQWVVDGKSDIEKNLDLLGKALDDITQFDLMKEDHYIGAACHLSMGRLLRILQAIDTAHPGAASRLLMYAEDRSKENDKAANLFIRRNIAFERLRLLSRIFSSERMTIVNKALEKEDEG